MSSQRRTLKRKSDDIRSFFQPKKKTSTSSSEPIHVLPQEDSTTTTTQDVDPQEDVPQEVNLQEVNLAQLNPQEIVLEEVNPQQVDPQEVDSQEVHTLEVNPLEVNIEEVNTQEVHHQVFDHQEVNVEEVHEQEEDPQDVDVEEADPQEVDYVNSIERDPGLRRQIWEYPINKRKEVREAYLRMGPYQWEPIVGDYPLTKSGKQNRKFNSKWFEKYHWLEYSPTKDKAYCFPCFLFESRQPQYPAFTTEGFNSWKRIGSKDCSFLQHVGGITSFHMSTVYSCEDLMTPSSHIDNVMNAKSKEEIMKNRMRVWATIECVRWLALQGCAFRGHDETNDSENCGNFLELLRFSAKLNDKIAAVILENAPGNAIYTSHDIQKQVLHLLAENVREQIRKEVGDSKFCVLVDEAQDNAYREQMAIILRFVDDGGYVKERFFAIVSVNNTNASTLKDAIFHTLAKYNLHICNLRGQGYDGASNMRGSWNGLQALISKECPHAYYVHCFAHRLQLALVGASNDVKEVWQFFSKLTSIVNFVNASPKRRTELKAVRTAEIEEMVALGEVGTSKGANQIRTLQRGGATRWSSHFASVHSMIDMFSSIGTVIHGITISGSSNSMRGEAQADYDHMNTFDFVFSLHLMYKTMGITNLLCKALQENSQDIINAIHLVSTTKELLQKLRNEGWDAFLKEVVSFCVKNEIEIPNMSAQYKKGKGRKNGFVTVEHHYHMDMFIDVIERQVTELERRFSDEAMELISLSSALDPTDGFKSFDIDDICKLAEKFYYHDFNEQDILILRSQLDHYGLDVVRNEDFRKLSTISELCHKLHATRKCKVYALVDKLIRLVLTLPVSTATTERAFSAMKLLKTNLRNKMEDAFLGDCMVIYIERQFAKNISTDVIVDEFDDMTDRRVQLR